MTCPDCGAILNFSSEENSMACEMCYYTYDGSPEQLTPSKMVKLLSANARTLTLTKKRIVARSAREFAID